MRPELRLTTELFVEVATGLREEPRPPMGDSFEEWLFWRVPAAQRYRSARQGVARVEERKMYIFPNPLTDPDLIGSVALVVEQGDLLTAFPQLVQVMVKARRTLAGEEYPFFVYRLRE